MVIFLTFPCKSLLFYKRKYTAVITIKINIPIKNIFIKIQVVCSISSSSLSSYLKVFCGITLLLLVFISKIS